MTFDPMIITWDMLGLIGDYCGKIQLTFRYRQHVNIADINML